MDTIFTSTGTEEFAPGGVEPLSKSVLAIHRPAAHFLCVRDAKLAGRCSIWTERTPDGLGIVGHYAAIDAQAGKLLLDHACHELRRRGFARAVGPMDGNTWRRYRLVTDRGPEPPFFLEPDNPDDYPIHFASAGFVPLAKYYSAVNEDLSVRDPRVPDAIARFEKQGGELRAIDLSRFEEELSSIHELSIEAFAKNFLYTPIAREEFLAMYAPLRARIWPGLVLMAFIGGELAGFMFAIPDGTQVIAKSMAVRPGRTGGGLGSILMDRLHAAAEELGFNRVIHALMHEDNRSLVLSQRTGRIIRQYTLYQRDLA